MESSTATRPHSPNHTNHNYDAKSSLLGNQSTRPSTDLPSLSSDPIHGVPNIPPRSSRNLSANRHRCNPCRCVVSLLGCLWKTVTCGWCRSNSNREVPSQVAKNPTEQDLTVEDQKVTQPPIVTVKWYEKRLQRLMIELGMTIGATGLNVLTNQIYRQAPGLNPNRWDHYAVTFSAVFAGTLVVIYTHSRLYPHNDGASSEESTSQECCSIQAFESWVKRRYCNAAATLFLPCFSILAEGATAVFVHKMDPSTFSQKMITISVVYGGQCFMTLMLLKLQRCYCIMVGERLEHQVRELRTVMGIEVDTEMQPLTSADTNNSNDSKAENDLPHESLDQTLSQHSNSLTHVSKSCMSLPLALGKNSHPRSQNHQQKFEKRIAHIVTTQVMPKFFPQLILSSANRSKDNNNNNNSHSLSGKLEANKLKQRVVKEIKSHYTELNASVNQLLNDRKNMVTHHEIKDMVTNDDIKDMVTSNDIRNMVTNDDIRNMVTNDDIKDMVTNDDIRDMVTHDDIKDMVTHDEIEGMVKQEQLLDQQVQINRLAKANKELKSLIMSIKNNQKNDKNATNHSVNNNASIKDKHSFTISQHNKEDLV